MREREREPQTPMKGSQVVEIEDEVDEEEKVDEETTKGAPNAIVLFVPPPPT